ncbi:hypothetical protein [Crateriforma conspicua]|uniref:Uncharacterized protein n=1 Tax=Crateriforma conspicua TaxID=2527996 RepID=A0A5C6FTS6_9PLAN|nr:hypothetical protein [Crateriforma conspicua]TWU66442.1 hypothetical protein V7x_20080 [Crateriforma conspicua]
MQNACPRCNLPIAAPLGMTVTCRCGHVLTIQPVEPTPQRRGLVQVPRMTDVIRPRRSLAVVTVAAGREAQELLSITGQRMEEYAEQCDADFVLLSGDQCPEWPIGNKFRVAQVADRYDRTLFIDVDVWIRRDAPNLFQRYEPGKVWMHDDTPYLDCVTWLRNEMAAVALSQQAKKPRPLKCWNTGVVLVDRSDAVIWKAPSKPIPLGHVMEQHHVTISAQRHGRKIVSIERGHNLQWWMKHHFRAYRSSADLIHLANAPRHERLHVLRHYEQTDCHPDDAADGLHAPLRLTGATRRRMERR